MITAIIGFPGMGKSLLLSYWAYRFRTNKALNFRGLTVSTFKNYDRLYTNFPCDDAYKLDFDKLGIAHYQNCFMLCDEIQLFADSRNFKQFGDNLTYWFSNHRKDHIDFVYCTQDYSMVDKRIRSVTDRIYYLDRTVFNLLRVREVLNSLDLKELGQTHELSGVQKLFIPRLLYKYNDTDYHFKSPYVEDAPDILW